MALEGEARDKTYVNLRPVGHGTSEVHLAYHKLFAGPVIQKTVPLSATVPDAVTANEPQLLNSLNHRSIPKVREAQFDPIRPGCLTFVMEMVGDHNVATDLVAGVAYSVGETVAVALDVLAGLDYLHSQGIVLRDIKPDNLRTDALRRQGWIIDLNLAGRLDASREATAIATPMAYMAPEVPTGRYAVSSELYSLGVTLIEMLHGTPLYACRDMAEIERRVTAGKRAYPDSTFAEWPPYVPQGLRRVLRKATHRSPTGRFPSAWKMRRALTGSPFVDWQPPRDDNGDSVYSGQWPGNRQDHTTSLEVHVRSLHGGPDRGKRRATALYRATGTAAWRRLSGLPDVTLEDDNALVQFFDDVDARIAQLRPIS